MNRDKILVETGMLILDRGRPVLRRDDGGHWRLWLENKSGHLIGHRVTIRAERSGFDELHVLDIVPGNFAPPERIPAYVKAWRAITDRWRNRSTSPRNL